jgi:hypothetical protein
MVWGYELVRDFITFACPAAMYSECTHVQLTTLSCITYDRVLCGVFIIHLYNHQI